MAFLPRRRPPVPFGYPLVGLASPGSPVDFQPTAWRSRFRLNPPLPQTSVAIDAPNRGGVVGKATPAEDQKAGPPSAVNGYGARSATQTGTSQDTDAESSSMAKDSGCSDKSECSSLAPYWIPEEIKHYFLHRHPDSGEDDSSRKVDLGLRAIGLERELPAVDDSNWAQRRCFRKPLHVVAGVMLAITASLLILLIAAMTAKYRITVIGSGMRHSAAEDEDAAGAHIANDRGDDLQPSVESEEHFRDADVLEAPHAADSRSENEKDENSRSDSDKEVAKHNAFKVNSGAVGSFGPGGSSRIWMKALCGQPAFKFCKGGPPQFYYNASGQACVMSEPRATGLCNRGRNRFTSMESCRKQCVDGHTPATKCYQRAVFAQCQARDIRETWWSHEDGKGCHRWRFPEGHCPSPGAGVFRTAQDCVRRCVDSRGPPCHAPTIVPCEFKHLHYGYIAVEAAHGVRARRCRELPSAGVGATLQHCLTGANRFPTMEACRKNCMRDHD